MRITIEVAGDKQLDRELLRVGERAGDASPAFSAIADILMHETELQFETAGAHASGGWRPLAPSTIAEKRRLGVDNGILRRTFDLEKSLTVRGDANQILDIDRNGMTFGTSLRYGEFHQLGRGVPRRRPVELTEDARSRIVKTLQRWLMTGELA